MVEETKEQKNHVSVKRFLKIAREKAKNANKTALKFTWGWVNSFFKRNGFKLRKPTSKEGGPKDLTQIVENFKRKISTLVKCGIYDLDHVVNFDETAVCFEGTSSKTICHDEEERNEKGKAITHPTTKSVNKDREYLTIALAGSWTGAKLKAMIIFPDKGIKKLDRDTPENIYKKHREEGSYMDRETMKSWISNVLGPYARKLPPNKRGLLLLDNFKGHISKDIKDSIKSLGYDVEELPACTTKYLQPLDISVNRAFKSQKK